MKQILLLTALAVPAMASAAAPVPLDAVTQHLRSVTTMTADFVQTDRDGKSLTGKLLLKRPGRIRFQYEKGVPLLVVGDGKALTMIDYSVRQVSRWPIGDSPLSVLMNPKADIARFGRLLPATDPNLLLVEARDPKRPQFGTITIAFSKVAGAPGGVRLDGWSVLDAQANRSSVRLSNQRFNTAIADEAFRWRDPRPKGPRG